jgi:hypothetical protein
MTIIHYPKTPHAEVFIGSATKKLFIWEGQAPCQRVDKELNYEFS